MELKWLEDFLALAELGNFSKAADARNVTQPAFGRRIKALEHWVGATLIDRETFPLELTPAGRVFHQSAVDLVQEFYRLRRELAPQGETGRDAVSFATPHVLAVSFLPRWLRDVRTSAGDFQAHVVCDNVLECIQRLISGECDFYVGFFNPQIPLVLDPVAHASLPLGTERLIPFAARTANGEPRYALPGSDTAAVPYLSYGAGTFLDRSIELHLENVGTEFHLDVVFTNSISDSLKAMAADGQGVAWLPESLVTEEDMDSRLAAAGDDAWHVELDRRLYRRLDNNRDVVERIWKSQR